jgi:hypothetical protein
MTSALRIAAAVLMLAGAALLITGSEAGLAFPPIAIGAALLVVAQTRTDTGRKT